MEQAVVKILLLGICGYGSNYIKEISERDIPGIKIEGICEVVPNAADLYPIIKEQNIPIYQTPEDFYKEHTADLAVVSTPIHLHYSQIVTCLTHGSNVLTEKPVCTSVEGARKLEQLEKETGKFISVGYQLNYSRDVLALKHDILDDRFGKPIYMKALHAMRRGDKYYARNSWAGHIDVKGCAVNDSPFNNACAHQFQVMTFLLGERLERAAELADVQAKPYKGNPNVDNFDTITVLAHTVSGVPLWYGTGHAIVDKKLGPIAEYRFEKGTVAKHIAFELGLLEAIDPTLQTVIGFVDGVCIVICGGGKHINVAELIVGLVQRIQAVEQRLHLAAHLVIIDRRGEDDDLGFLDLCHDFGCVILQYTTAAFLAGHASDAEPDIFAAQGHELNLMPRILRAALAFLCQNLRIAVSAQAGGNYKNLLCHR